MLQSMRESAKSWVTFVIVGIIAFMMAITGLETLAPNPNNTEVATVNGEEITRAQLVQSMEQQRRVLIQRMGDQFDPSLINDEQLRESVLNSLIDRALLLQEAEAGGMDVGQQELDAMIVSMPEFQQDGKFNQDRFMMMVRSFGMSPLQFRSLMRDETILAQLQAGVAGSEFVTQQEIQQLTALESQKRDIAWLTLDAAALRQSIQPSEEEVQSYYESNSDQFMTEEQVVISYVELQKSSVAQDLEVSEDDIRDEYQRRVQAIEEQPVNTTVSTILLQTGDKRSSEEANKLAGELISKLKSGEDFAKLAQEYSDDPVTSANGGDMGVVQPGFFGDDFDNAIAELEVGQVSQPVGTDFGVQILKVTKKDIPQIPDFNSLKVSIEDDLKLQEAESLYIDETRKLADISFEASDLVQPAEQLGLKIKTLGPFTRQGGVGIAADPRVSAAAFGEEVLELGANSELIEFTPEKAVVLRVKEHLKPELKPLADVKAVIVDTLKAEKARQQLSDKASAMIAKLESGDSMVDVAKQEAVSWTEFSEVARRQQGVPQQLLSQTFKMPHPAGGQLSFAQVELPEGDIALITLKKVIEGQAAKADANRDRMMAKFIANGNGQNLFTEYLQSLKGEAKIKIIKEE